MRRSTPRPSYNRAPAFIRNAEARHHFWGDPEAGSVSDRVFLSTDSLHVLEYQLAPGNSFRHSPLNPTVFAADVVYIVVEGRLVLTNPETGEVLPLATGEAVLFRRDTWHHGFNPSPTESVRVLEFLSPPPSRGTASDYARVQPYLETSRYSDDRWAGRWPEQREAQQAARTLLPITERDYLWSFAEDSVSHLVGTLADTPYLRVVRGTVNPGGLESFRPVENESALYCTAGRLWVDICDEAGETFTVGTLNVGDVAYLPAGCRARMMVRDSEPAEYFLGAGPLMPEGWTP